MTSTTHWMSKCTTMSKIRELAGCKFTNKAGYPIAIFAPAFNICTNALHGFLLTWASGTGTKNTVIMNLHCNVGICAVDLSLTDDSGKFVLRWDWDPLAKYIFPHLNLAW
eukprot:TRINITY_DN66726_c7_g6_i1.p1 TRINITY_DN66726_c7_g6~~TRINITY_DN66726_c7_g6_i1.p1  ORF type:complete len:110 (-),score=9.33 TRINITY_DN66726_c7_g6_i1:303-632(-)